MSRPPAMRTIGGSKARSAAIDRVRLRALRVVDEPDAVEDRDRLEAMLDARERDRGRAGSPPGRARRGARRATAASALETLWRPGIVSSDGRHDPARRRRRRSSSPLDADAARAAAARAGRRSIARGPRPAYAATTGSSALRIERPVGVDELGQSPLRRPVALQRPVPVEVVGRDVRVDGDRRAARQRRQLELRQLDDDAVLRRELGQPLDERDPDVAAEDHRVVGIRGEDRGDQRRRRRLALRPGDPDRRGRAEAQEQVRLGDECRRGRRIRAVPSDEILERRPQARLGRRVVGVDRRRRRDERGAGPGRSGATSGPARIRTGRPSSAADGVGQLGSRAGRRRS